MNGHAASKSKTVLHSAMGHNREDYEAFYASTNVHQFSEIHNHDFYEIYIHLRGGRTLWINDRVYSLEPGSMIIFPPFQMHGMINREKLYDYERAFLYITSETMRTIGYGIMPIEQILIEKTKQGLYKFNLASDICSRCVELLKRIASHMEDESPDMKLQDYASMIEFLLLICRTVRNTDNACQSQVENEIMQDVMCYINTHFTCQLTLDGIALHFNISKSYLSHEFIRYTNHSVYSYILYKRVAMAKEMIFAGERLIEISYQCGFNDYSSFLRAFKKIAGISPREYAKKIKEIQN